MGPCPTIPSRTKTIKQHYDNKSFDFWGQLLLYKCSMTCLVCSIHYLGSTNYRCFPWKFKLFKVETSLIDLKCQHNKNEYLSGTYKWAFILVNILLINFISKQEQSLLVTKSQYLLKVVHTKALSGWVSGIYNHHRPYLSIILNL